MPLQPACANRRPPYPEVTEVNCRVPSTSFSQAPWYTLPVHLCRFRVRSIAVELFPGTASPHTQSSKGIRHTRSVTTSRPTNINVVPIDYAFRPRLRGRLTLLRLTLSRNPWSFGEGVSHPLYRYSCQHSHFRYLQQSSRICLRRLTERSATAHLAMHPKLRCMALAPLHFRRKDPYLDQ